MNGYFAEHSAEIDHGRRSLHAGVVTVGARVLMILIQVTTVLVLARLLSPEDYGLVAMVTAFTAFAPLLVSLGTPDAVVQRTHVSKEDMTALFWISVAVGCTGAALMIIFGPLIARFYGEPRLTWIAAVSAVTFLASAVSCQHITLLRRAMKFNELAAVEVSANLLSACIAIGFAFYGFEYWALVLRPVMLNCFIALGVWLRCRWVPGAPRMSVGAKDLLRQGLRLAGFFVTDFIAGSSDRVAIGYWSGPTPLGYYQNAVFVYENLCSLLVLSAHNVAVSSLVKSRSNVLELRRLWAKALLTVEFFAMPAFGLLAVTGQDVVVTLFGSKWSQAGMILSILALRGIPHAVERTMGWLHVSAGRPDRWMRWGLVGMCAQLAALFCGLPYGPTGVAVAFVVCSFVMFIPAIAYSGRPLGIGVSDVIMAIWSPFVASFLAAAIGFALRFAVVADMSAMSRIIVLAAAYTGAYLVIVVGVFGELMPLRVLFALVEDALSQRIAWTRSRISGYGASVTEWLASRR